MRLSNYMKYLKDEYSDIYSAKIQLILLCFNVSVVGMMVGIERSVVPIYGLTEFKLSQTALLSFIVAFGLSKGTGCLIIGELSMYLISTRGVGMAWVWKGVATFFFFFSFFSSLFAVGVCTYIYTHAFCLSDAPSPLLYFCYK